MTQIERIFIFFHTNLLLEENFMNYLGEETSDRELCIVRIIYNLIFKDLH